MFKYVCKLDEIIVEKLSLVELSLLVHNRSHLHNQLKN